MYKNTRGIEIRDDELPELSVKEGLLRRGMKRFRKRCLLPSRLGMIFLRMIVAAG